MGTVFAEVIWRACAERLANCPNSSAFFRATLFDNAEIKAHLGSEKTAVDPNVLSCDPLFQDSPQRIAELLRGLEASATRLHSEDQLSSLLQKLQTGHSRPLMPDILGEAIQGFYRNFFIEIADLIEPFPQSPASFRLRRSMYDSPYHSMNQIRNAYQRLLADLSIMIRQAGAASITQWSSFEQICKRIQNRNFDYSQTNISIFMSQSAIHLPAIAELDAGKDLLKAYQALRDSREKIINLLDLGPQLKQKLKAGIGEGQLFSSHCYRETLNQVASEATIDASKLREASKLLENWQNSVLLFRDIIKIGEQFFDSSEAARLSPPALVEWLARKSSQKFNNSDLRNEIEQQIRVELQAYLDERDPLGITLLEPHHIETKLPSTTSQPFCNLLSFFNSPNPRICINREYETVNTDFISINQVVLGLDRDQGLQTEIAARICEIMGQQRNSLIPFYLNPLLAELNTVLRNAYPAWEQIMSVIDSKQVKIISKIDGLTKDPIEAQICEWLKGIEQLQALLRTDPENYSTARVGAWLANLAPSLEFSHLCRSASVFKTVARIPVQISNHSESDSGNSLYKKVMSHFISIDFNRTDANQPVVLVHRDALDGIVFSLSIRGRALLLKLAKQELILIDSPSESAVSILNSSEEQLLTRSLVAEKQKTGRILPLSKFSPELISLD